MPWTCFECQAQHTTEGAAKECAHVRWWEHACLGCGAVDGYPHRTDCVTTRTP